MKKLIPLFVLMVILLWGCGVDQEEGTAAGTGETVHYGDLYIPDSAVEQESGGTVFAYRVPGSYSRLYMLGENVLLVSEDGGLLLQDPDGISATPALMETDAENACLCVSDGGIGYFIPETREIVICNARLQETNRFTLPEEMVGMPVISLLQNEVYYCTRESVRARDMDTGIARLVRQNSQREQSLTGGFFGDTVIACKVSVPSETTMYLSAEDGEMRYSDNRILQLETDENRFFAIYQDGIVGVQITGALDEGEMREFLPADVMTAAAWELNGLVTCGTDDEKTCFDLYSLETGARVSGVRLSGVSRPCAVASDGKGIWFLTENTETGEPVLLRWDPGLSPVTDEQSCFGPLYTELEPDVAGLEQCDARAKELSERYGVQVLLYQDALELTGERHLQAEYQPEAYCQVLNEIESALDALPEELFQKITDIQIGIVREIAGREDPLIVADEQKTVMLLPVDCRIRQSIFLCVGYALDIKGIDYSGWCDLNPEDFQYGEDRETLPEGFLNLESTKDEQVERAYLFAAAMDDENNVFSSDILQKKLLYLCEALRTGLDLTDAELPWEQYLE